MTTRTRAFHGAALLAVVLAFTATSGDAQTANGVALIGQVTSADDGPMEGVLVSAKRTGSTVTVTVVTDAQGRYRFPGPRLAPGPYALSIRATGYELDGPDVTTVAAQKTATADLKLRKTKDLAAQLTNAEWLMSMPGPDTRKLVLLGCVQCHTLERTA